MYGVIGERTGDWQGKLHSKYFKDICNVVAAD